jgi:hypothetical protein
LETPPVTIEPPSDSVRANHGPDSDEYQSTLAQDLRDAYAECLTYGIDPYSIMVDELRNLGWAVIPPGCPFDLLHACPHLHDQHVIHLGTFDLNMDDPDG